jgi:hypothetical protein
MKEVQDVTVAENPWKVDYKATFAIILTWPELKNAEYEVIQRIAKAATRVTINIIIVDNHGYMLWSNFTATDCNTRLDFDTCDFVISLHFESPKFFDAYHYIALWNPPEFYFQFGYDNSVEKLISHDDLISCRSVIANSHALNLLSGFHREVMQPLPELFHSVPEPFLEPRITEHSKIFYIGINWERLGQAVGRHHELLKFLDEKDLIAIYGPEFFHGVKPWEGYKNYQGELPFDGDSVIESINSAGICLAFSSDAHRRSEIMSNRLFEGIAGGAVVIADAHPFVMKYFADCVLVVDHMQDAASLIRDVVRKVEHVRRDIAGATAMVKTAQARVRQLFSLEGKLAQLVNEHPKRARLENTHPLPRISVILVHMEPHLESLIALLKSVLKQKAVELDLFLICDSRFFSTNQKKIEALIGTSVQFNVLLGKFHRPAAELGSYAARDELSGPYVLQAMSLATGEFFALARDCEEWFSDHLYLLHKSLSRNPAAFFCASGEIIESMQPDRKLMRRLVCSSFKDVQSLCYAHNVRHSGQFLYRSSLIPCLPKEVFQLLDLQEHNVLSLLAYTLGELENSGRATYVFLEHLFNSSAKPAMPVEQQHQFIRDCVAGQPEWMRRAIRIANPPQFVFANGHSARIYWQNYQTPFSAVHQLPLNRKTSVAVGKEGLKYLEKGFSFPEPDRVWIEGLEASLNFIVPATDKILELLISLGGLSNGDKKQHCLIAINGFVLGYLALDEQAREFKCLIPSSLSIANHNCRLSIIADRAEVVVDESGQRVDDRRLGVYVTELGIFEEGSAEQIDENQTLPIKVKSRFFSLR